MESKANNCCVVVCADDKSKQRYIVVTNKEPDRLINTMIETGAIKGTPEYATISENVNIYNAIKTQKMCIKSFRENNPTCEYSAIIDYFPTGCGVDAFSNK